MSNEPLVIATKLTPWSFLDAVLDSPVISPNIRTGKLTSEDVVTTANGVQIKVSNLDANIGEFVITHEIR